MQENIDKHYVKWTRS